MFNWVTNGRFFSYEIYEDRIEKANDRARKQKRPMYCRFIEEYMPSSGKATVICSDTSTSNSSEISQAVVARPSRQDVLQEALRLFNKQKNYDAVILKFQSGEIEDALWKNISASIPQPHGATISGLKKWVAFQDGSPYILNEPLSKKNKLRWTEHLSKDGLSNILTWVEKNRAKVRELEKNRADEARKASMKK